MKDVGLLVWLTQLGLSVAVPPVAFVLLAVWLRDTLGWGPWIVWVGIIFGVVSAVDGVRSSIKVMERLSKNKSEKDAPPAAFNDHE